VVTGRNTSTISRELRRNADPTTGLYLPATADRLAAGRVQAIRDAMCSAMADLPLHLRRSLTSCR